MGKRGREAISSVARGLGFSIGDYGSGALLREIVVYLLLSRTSAEKKKRARYSVLSFLRL